MEDDVQERKVIELQREGRHTTQKLMFWEEKKVACGGTDQEKKRTTRARTMCNTVRKCSDAPNDVFVTTP